jgi:hypothetical protein
VKRCRANETTDPSTDGGSADLQPANALIVQIDHLPILGFRWTISVRIVLMQTANVPGTIQPRISAHERNS